MLFLCLQHGVITLSRLVFPWSRSERFIRGPSPPPAEEEEKSISERREDRKLQEIAGKDLTKVVSLKEKLEFAPRAVLNRNRPEKS